MKYWNGIIFEDILYSNVLTSVQRSSLVTALQSKYPDSLATYTNSKPLLLWYKMNEGSGTNLVDASGNNNDGYLSGATWTTGASGSGYSLTLDGISNYARSTNNITFGTNVITICAWIYWTNITTTTTVLWESSENAGENDHCFACYIDYDPLPTSVIQDSTGTYKFLSKRFPAWTGGQWIHLAIVLDNSTSAGAMYIYVNTCRPTLVDANTSKDASGNFATKILYLGSRAGSSLFAGCRIDDLRIYKGALNWRDVYKVYTDPQ